jgi:hypothetical protein
VASAGVRQAGAGAQHRHLPEHAAVLRRVVRQERRHTHLALQHTSNSHMLWTRDQSVRSAGLIGQSVEFNQFRCSVQLLCASEGTLSHWSRLHLQSLAPTNPHWARVVGYGSFSLWIVYKECLCPRSGDIHMLIMSSVGLFT